MSGECDKCGEHALECKCDLKPCPFCAGNDIYYVSCYPWGTFSCSSCNADGPPIRRSDDKVNFDDVIRMLEAKKCWNKRVG